MFFLSAFSIRGKEGVFVASSIGELITELVVKTTNLELEYLVWYRMSLFFCFSQFVDVTKTFFLSEAANRAVCV